MEQKGANCVVDYWQNNWRIVFNKRTNDRVVFLPTVRAAEWPDLDFGDMRSQQISKPTGPPCTGTRNLLFFPLYCSFYYNAFSMECVYVRFQVVIYDGDSSS